MGINGNLADGRLKCLTELEDAKSQVESKTRGCVALVDEQECLNLELEFR